VLPPVLFAHQLNLFKHGVGAKVNVAPYAIHYNVRTSVWSRRDSHHPRAVDHWLSSQD